MNNSKFKSLLIYYALYVWFSKVSSSIIPAYLLSRGATINQMFLASVLQFIPMLIVLLFVRIKSARLSWRLALVSVLLAVFSVVNIRFNFQIYLTYIFSGIALALFFVYYNVGHFLYTPKGRAGISGGIMYAVNPVISIFAPIIAGGLAMSHINYLWAICLISFVVVFWFTSKQIDFSLSYSLKNPPRYLLQSVCLFLLKEFGRLCYLPSSRSQHYILFQVLQDMGNTLGTYRSLVLLLVYCSATTQTSWVKEVFYYGLFPLFSHLPLLVYGMAYNHYSPGW
jgi:hypothetical protein